MKTRPYVFFAMFSGALTMFAADVFACGESLFRVGQGVRYRAYAVPIPANVLVYANTKEQLEMAHMLAQAGHGVQIVNDATELDRHLDDGRFDVVIAPIEERSLVEGKASSASYLPVFDKNTDGEGVAKRGYKYSLASNANIKQYLKLIHRTIKKAKA